MNPFSLEEYLKNPSRKVVTRDGRNVRIICTDAKGLCPIVALVDYGKYEVAFNVTKDGRLDDVSDLFFTQEKHEGWVNLYRNTRDVIYVGSMCTSEKEAKENIYSPPRYVTTIKIEWEE